YDLLRQHNASEKVKEILRPFQFPEQLAIETTECRAVNSYYQRKKQSVTNFSSAYWNYCQTKPPLTDPLRRMRPLGSFSRWLSMRLDIRDSRCLTYASLDTRKMLAIALQHSLCCNLAKAKRGD